MLQIAEEGHNLEYLLCDSRAILHSQIIHSDIVIIHLSVEKMFLESLLNLKQIEF